MLKHFGTISTMTAAAAILKIFYFQLIWSFAPGQLMPRSVDHGPSFICMSISNFSHFRHLSQNLIQDGRHDGHLKSLKLLSAPEQCRMERKLGGRQWGSIGI